MTSRRLLPRGAISWTGVPSAMTRIRGKLSGLIIHWSQVRSLPGPQLFPQVMCYIRTPQVIPREPIEPLVSALCLPARSARPTVCTTVCPCVAPPLVRPPNQAVRQPVPSLLHTSIPLTSAGGLVFSLSAGATSRVGVPTIDDAVTGPALGLRALGKRERPPVVDVGHLPQHFDHHCSPS